MSFSDRFDALRLQAAGVSAEIRSSERKVKQTEDLLAIQQETLAADKEAYEIAVQAQECLRQIIEQKSQDHLDKVRSLLTLAMKTIFPDRNYSIEIEIEEKRGVSNAGFVLVETFPDGSCIKNYLESETGGSIRAICGFVLQVFYLRYFKLYPVVYIDEAFGSISAKYIPGLVSFMKQLSELRGYIFVWVTHDQRVIPFADTVYRVADRTVTKVSG